MPQILWGLAANNERDWFKARKATYEEEVKAPLELLLLDGARRLEREDLPLTAHPKRSRFRIQNYVVRRMYPDEALQTPDFTDEVVRMARDVQPLLDFVWAAHGEA